MSLFEVGYLKTYSTIGAAITAAGLDGSTPHTIRVFKQGASSWTYQENITFTNVVNLQGSTFTCQDADGRITIDANGAGRVIYTQLNTLTIDGFSLINADIANHGGGINVYPTAPNTVMKNLKIYDNEARHGAGVMIVALNCTMQNCLVCNNTCKTGYRGGGIYLSNNNDDIENCTITGNTADEAEGGGGFYFVASTANKVANLKNTVIWGNTNNAAATGHDITIQSLAGKTATVNVTKCVLTSTVENTYVNKWGAGTQTTNYISKLEGIDPEFVGSGDDPYDIQAISPCIDYGETLAGITTDIIGRERPSPAGGSFDVGAYEYQWLVEEKVWNAGYNAGYNGGFD